MAAATAAGVKPAESSSKPKKKDINVNFIKSQQHPWENRACLSDNYENPVTDREAWWRCNIRVTPIPGSYESHDFIKELSKRPNSYRFKSDGRKLPSDLAGKGALLMPGEYEYQDFVSHLSQKPATYRFKAGRRDAFDVLNFGKKDKDINVSPSAYELEKYYAVDQTKAPVKNSMFRSQSKRFPNIVFKPKEGPSPGAYSVKDISGKGPSITSSFRSKTPRFNTSHTKVPGPGSYEKAFQHPLPPTISKMGRQYGLFFTSDFQT